MNDAPPEIDRMVRESLLARSGSERLKMGSRMLLMARQMILAPFPPGLPELEIKRRLCERLYGDEVVIADFIANLQVKEKR